MARTMPNATARRFARLSDETWRTRDTVWWRARQSRVITELPHTPTRTGVGDVAAGDLILGRLAGVQRRQGRQRRRRRLDCRQTCRRAASAGTPASPATT